MRFSNQTLLTTSAALLLGLPGLAAYANGPLELDLVLDGTETYTTTFVDPGTDFPIIVNRSFHDIDKLYVNGNGEVLLAATLDRGPGSDSRIDTLFYSPVTNQSGRPDRLWDALTGSPVDGASSRPNGAAEWKFANDGSYAMNTNGVSRIELGQNLDSASPDYSIIAENDSLPPIPISSAGDSVMEDRVKVNLVNTTGGGEVYWNAESFTDGFARTISALYRTNPDGSVDRILGADDTVSLAGGGNVTLDGAYTIMSDAGDSVIQNGGTLSFRDVPFYSRSAEGQVAALFEPGQAVPGSSTLTFGEPDFNQTTFDIDPSGSIIFGNPTEGGSSPFGLDAGLFRAQAGVAGSLETLALTGETMIDGKTLLGVDFDESGTDPRFLGTDGDVVFLGAFDENDPYTALVRYDAQTDQFDTILSKGDAIGDSGFTFAGGTNVRGEFDVNGLGQIAMVTDVLDGDGQELEALIAFDPNLGFFTVAVEGEKIDADGIQLTVEDIQGLFSDRPDGGFGAGLESGFLSDNGWLAFGIETDNERYYAFRTQLPIPEPSSAMLLGAAGMLLISRRRRRTA